MCALFSVAEEGRQGRDCRSPIVSGLHRPDRCRGPFPRRMTWSLPDTYHAAGQGRGTAILKFHEGRDILRSWPRPSYGEMTTIDRGRDHNTTGGRSDLRVGDGRDFLLNADQRKPPVSLESKGPRLGDNRVGKLLRRVEGVVHWAAVAPALGRLPTALGYRIACWR